MKFLSVASLFALAIGSATTPTLVSAETPPSVLESIPGPNVYTTASSYVFQVRAIDADGPIRNVKFLLMDPLGNILSKENGVKQDVVDPEGAELWVSPDMQFTMDGQWRWQALVLDQSGNKVKSDWEPIQILTNGVSTAISLIRKEIEDLVLIRPELKPKFLRMGFHDCVGGCDGCIDLDNGDNNGLDIPIDALIPIVTKWANNDDMTAVVGSSISRADIWALAALVGADKAVGNDRPANLEFSMSHVGRIDCENADEFGVGGDHRDLPSPDLTTAQLLAFFETEFDFDADETVCIMGAHSLGRAKVEHSGFNGSDGWVFNPNQLNSGYFDMLVGGSVDPDNFWDLVHAPAWDQVLIDNTELVDINSRYQWIHQKLIDGVNDTRPDQTLFMVNSDIALVRDLDGYMSDDENGVPGQVTCSFRCRGTERLIGCETVRGLDLCPAASTLMKAKEYKFDNDLFLLDFEATLEKMLLAGYNYGDDLEAIM